MKNSQIMPSSLANIPVFAVSDQSTSFVSQECLTFYVTVIILEFKCSLTVLLELLSAFDTVSKQTVHSVNFIIIKAIL